ncbi:PKD domain-containing protein [Pedobacter panaciterrae]|uniref:PKD domain-containing protein n=1 Tax=Pedobacter panaciterrae TaxID=363849 RepID=UPI0025933463|nr:PKD domain-containing protein [uncultured Pedobacter sp.]
MNNVYRKLFSFVIFIFIGLPSIVQAQPEWQWGRRGGSTANSDGPGSNGPEGVIDMATDNNGNIYVLASNSSGALAQVGGHLGLGPGDQVTLASWDCSGQFRWMKNFGALAPVTGTGLGIDTLGGVYVTGSVASTNELEYAYFDTDTTLGYTFKSMFIIKYDTAGTFQWLNMPQADTIAVGNSAGALGVDVSKSGEVYIFCILPPGSYNSGSAIITEKNFYVLEYDKEGVYQNKTKLNISVSGDFYNSFGFGTLGLGSFTRFSRDHRNGRFYLVGQYNKTYGNLSFGSTAIAGSGGVSGYPIFLAAFDSDGDNLWAKQSSEDNSVTNRNCKAVFDGKGNVFIGGDAFADGINSFNGFTFTNSLDVATSIPFVISLDSTGLNIWGTAAGADNFTTAGAIAYKNNTVAMSGAFPYTIKWGMDSMTTDIGADGSFLPFVAWLNATTGSVIGLDSVSANLGDNQSHAVALDHNNNIYIGGRFADRLYVSTDVLTNVGGNFDWYVAKYGSSDCNCTIPAPNYTYTVSGGNNLSFTYTGTGVYTSISWDFGDGSPGVTTVNPEHTYTTAGTYTVCVTVTNDCGRNIYCMVVNTSSMGIGMLPGFSNVNIYPIPVTQSIHIDNAAGMVFEVYNTAGICFTKGILKGDRETIDIHTLASGIYLLHLTSEDGRQATTRFVKE